QNSPGLLAYYRFENSQQPAEDSSPAVRHARMEGEAEPEVASAHAPLGTALRLASGSHLRLPDLGEHDAVSIELWLSLRQPVAEGIAALYGADGWSSQLLHFNLKASGAVELAIHGVGGYPNTAPQTIAVGPWYHLVATYDRGAAVQRIFCNGRLIH